MSGYFTIKNEAVAEFVEKKSRFIGHALKITSEEEALFHIERVKKKHWDATHNVYGYMLKEGNISRFSDDGEPQGTAGVPVLSVLKKREVFDTLIVVTRYFGGTMLGAGGLIRAYSQSAQDALEEAALKRMELCTNFRLECSYELYGTMQNVIAKHKAFIQNTDFSDKISVLGYAQADLIRYLEKDIIEASSGKLTLKTLEEEFLPV